ncbi:MAG: hypothetical protein ABFQ62_01835 [Patescibacteria group bacterium]
MLENTMNGPTTDERQARPEHIARSADGGEGILAQVIPAETLTSLKNLYEEIKFPLWGFGVFVVLTIVIAISGGDDSKILDAGQKIVDGQPSYFDPFTGEPVYHDNQPKPSDMPFSDSQKWREYVNTSGKIVTDAE